MLLISLLVLAPSIPLFVFVLKLPVQFNAYATLMSNHTSSEHELLQCHNSAVCLFNAVNIDYSLNTLNV